MSNQPERPFQSPQGPLPQGYGQQPPQQYPGNQPPPGYPGFQGQNQPSGYYSNPSYPIQPMVYADAGPKGLSLAGMIIGLVSLLVGALIIPPIVGAILSHIGWSKEQPQGRGFAIAGMILNYVSLLIWGIAVFVPFIILIVVGIASSAGNH